MMNLLFNFAPSGTGRALLTIEPSAALVSIKPEAAVEANVLPFADVLLESSMPVDGLVAREDEGPAREADSIEEVSSELFANAGAAQELAPPLPPPLPIPSLQHAVQIVDDAPYEADAMRPVEALTQRSRAFETKSPLLSVGQVRDNARDVPHAGAVGARVTVSLHTGAPVAPIADTLVVPNRGMPASVDVVSSITINVVAQSTPFAPSPVLMGSSPEPVGSTELLAAMSQPSAHLQAAQLVLAAGAASAQETEAPVAYSRPTLATALGERLQVQVGKGVEQAVVRLDPPSMGSIEIIIRQESGQLQVQLRATHSEVARQLHAIGETLRQDLVQRQQGDVTVQVWDGQREGDGRQRPRYQQPWRDEPGLALNHTDEQGRPGFALPIE